MTDLFPLIAEERLRVADFLDTLTDEQWCTQSCCGEWTNELVVAHMLVGPVLGLRGSMPAMLKARFNLARANDINAHELAKMGRDAMVAALREHAEHRFTPPGFGPEAPLTDIIIHGQDISRPLGVELDVPTSRWTYALKTAVSPRFGPISARKHLPGLRFEATDLDFTHGTGPSVTGPARDLAHAMWGRVSAVNALTGDGVATLRTNLS